MRKLLIIAGLFGYLLGAVMPVVAQQGLEGVFVEASNGSMWLIVNNQRRQIKGQRITSSDLRQYAVGAPISNLGDMGVSVESVTTQPMTSESETQSEASATPTPEPSPTPTRTPRPEPPPPTPAPPARSPDVSNMSDEEFVLYVQRTHSQFGPHTIDWMGGRISAQTGSSSGIDIGPAVYLLFNTRQYLTLWDVSEADALRWGRAALATVKQRRPGAAIRLYLEEQAYYTTRPSYDREWCYIGDYSSSRGGFYHTCKLVQASYSPQRGDRVEVRNFR